MITLETLQIINADLDAERVGVRIQNCRTKEWKMEDLESLPGSVVTLTEEEEDEHAESHTTKAANAAHMKLHEEMIAFYELLGKMVSLDIAYNWRWYSKVWFWFAVIAALISCWTCMLYTIIIHILNDEYVRILEPLVISGLVVSATQKLYTSLKHWNERIALLFHLRSVCRRTTEGSSRANILMTGIQRNLRFMKLYAVGILLATAFYLVVPIKVYLVDKEFMSLIPMEVLFCDQSTMTGFIVANVVQAIMGTYAGFITMVYGLFFITLIFDYEIGVDLLAEDFKDLDRMWTGEGTVSVAYRHAFLKNICMKRQDMNNYLDIVKEMYATKLFYYFCFNYFSQIICMYQTTINNWQCGYGPFFGIFIEMMFYCFMGIVNDLISYSYVLCSRIAKYIFIFHEKAHECLLSDDRLCHVIYDTKWYEYDLKSQKVILMMLAEAQRSREIKLRILGSLKLVTFITICKSMYTYYTVLSEVL